MLKKLLLYGVGGAALLVAGLYVAGMLLDPVVHTKVSIEIARPPAQVFDLMRDMEATDKWAGNGMKAVKVSNTPRRYKLTAEGMESEWEEIEAREPEFLFMRMNNHTMDASGDWRIRIEAVGSGSSQVTNEIAMRFNKPLFRVIGHMMDPGEEERKVLAALKKYLEEAK